MDFAQLRVHRLSRVPSCHLTVSFADSFPERLFHVCFSCSSVDSGNQGKALDGKKMKISSFYHHFRRILFESK